MFLLGSIASHTMRYAQTVSREYTLLARGTMSKRSIERPTHPATGSTTRTEAAGPGDAGPTRTRSHPHLQRIAHTHPMLRMTPALLTFQRRRHAQGKSGNRIDALFGPDMTRPSIRTHTGAVPKQVAPYEDISAIEMQHLPFPRFRSIQPDFGVLSITQSTQVSLNCSGEQMFIF